MLVASYFEKRKPNTIAKKTGIQAVFLPLSVDAIPEVSDNFKLVDYWIDSINESLEDTASSQGNRRQHRKTQMNRGGK